MESQPTSSEIIIYQTPEGNMPVQVTYLEETFWLTQAQMGQLFGVSTPTINEHLKNIFQTEELQEKSVIRKFRITATDGKRYLTNHYNLDAIIAVGYRVNSKQATHFRQWATQTLREYIIKGFVLNDEMLKNGQPFGKDYFDELLKRVRDIRASERRFYLKICDIFQAISIDYNKNSPLAREFYQEVQNRFHYATTGQTAPELIHARADANKPNMGLTTWKGAPEGKIYSYDVTVAKNYLDEDELNRLNRLSTGFLDAIESRIENQNTTTMSECIGLVNQYIQFTGGTLLQGKGKVTRKQADKKAKSEYGVFNQTQLNDFEKFVKQIGQN